MLSFLKKLGRLGIDSKTKKLIEKIISERKQKVLINNVKSDEITLERGVPQGTVLGPALFNTYINDQRDQIDKNCEVVEYADDTLLLASSSIQQECKTSLKLTLNPSKTEFFIFSPNRNFLKSESIKIGNKINTESKKASNILGYILTKMSVSKTM